MHINILDQFAYIDRGVCCYEQEMDGCYDAVGTDAVGVRICRGGGTGRSVFPGLIEEDPTDPVYPDPQPTAKHVHRVSTKIYYKDYSRHWLHDWCPDCGRLVKERIEGHTFVDGVCTVCEWVCPHAPEAAVKYTERDGVKPEWDGNYIIGPGWEITECGTCHTVLSRVETTVREFHNLHTHFTPVLDCVPHDNSTHALIRFCDECGTEVPIYAAHNCPPSDAPYTDDGDPDTHVHLVKCDDCGDMVPQRQAHTWVHDSYGKDETDGGEEGHIEVMKCSVCGAKKSVWQSHDTGTHVAYRQDGNANTHIEVLRCTLCNETFETERPHELEHASCRNDGDTNTHIEVLVCTLCEAEVEKREAHKPMHLYWKSVSDAQDQETVSCNLCGLTYTCAPVAHTFNTYAYVSDGAGSSNHTKYAACSKCGMRNNRGAREAHTWHLDGDKWGDYCTKCNEAGWHTHLSGGGRSEKGFRSVDENNHIGIWVCLDCFTDFEWRTSAHTFDPVSMKCTACGYLKEGCEHHYTYKPAKNGIQEKQHTMIGTCSGCGKQITVTGAHDMQFVSATEFKPDGNGHARVVTERCSVCGYENQPTESEGHNMQMIAILGYEPLDEIRHYYTFSEQCSVCGYNGEATLRELHTFVSCESIGAQEHKLICSKCGGYATQQHQFVCTDDETAHVCSVCNERGEHDYAFAERRNDRSDEFHVCVYLCIDCYHLIEENEEHTMEAISKIKLTDTYHVVIMQCTLCGYQEEPWEEHTFDESGVCACGAKKEDYDRHTLIKSFEQFTEHLHNKIYQCTTCGYYIGHIESHIFDESGVCVCGYRKGDSVSEVPLGEGLAEGSGDGNAVMPVFCHLTADGKEMLCGYAFDPSEDGQTIDLILLPESLSGDPVIEVRFTASEMDLLQSLGIKNVYIRLNDTDLLLLSGVGQVADALSELERDELLIILTPDSGGAYTAQYDPAGVYITE